MASHDVIPLLPSSRYQSHLVYCFSVLNAILHSRHLVFHAKSQNAAFGLPAGLFASMEINHTTFHGPGDSGAHCLASSSYLPQKLTFQTSYCHSDASANLDTSIHLKLLSRSLLPFASFWGRGGCPHDQSHLKLAF
jgi:hypothetical protein